ncbi:glycosyltransferase family 2 protein [Bacteroides faecis]|uniref:glycosyltransferase family 2 protein n=1 Tax=Bacteroides faecis TaxID=674529 RepID=UPI0018A1B2BB|nr:glycosyltransferase family 2 protein [Bacteroides faecis]
MKISVIIPVYNAESYIGRCIESVQVQTFGDWQMILVDDGSNDNSLAICQKYAEIDDGSIVRKEYLSVYKNMKKDDFMRAQMTGKINWGGVRKVVKREILEKNNIKYSNHKVGEEALFTYCSVYYSQTIAFIEKPAYFYILRADSLSHTKMDDPWGEVALALKAKTLDNGSYAKYADTVNAFILTAAAVSADRLAVNYKREEYRKKIESLYISLIDKLDKAYPIDYNHMSLKAKFLGKLLLGRHFSLIRAISRSKRLMK